MEKKNRPERHFKFGGVRVSVWRDTRNAPNGKQFETTSVTVDRAYKDSNGDWKNTSSLKENDIPKAIAALQRAFAYLTEKKSDQTDDVNVVTEETV